MPEEAIKTKKAREKIIELYKQQGYEVMEEVQYLCTNNMGEYIEPPYQADITLTKRFIIELDPIFHGSKIHRNKDEWRDKNIYNQYNQIKTVRLDPADIIKQDPIDTIIEVDDQLNTFKKRHNLN